MSTRGATTAPILSLDAIRSRPVADVLAERLGRPVRGLLLSQDTISPTRPPGLPVLKTTGPVVHRHVVLQDSRPPHLTVAVAWALMVETRLPRSARVGLAGTGEPLDRLLTGHRVAWTAQLTERVSWHPVGEASAHFAWALSCTPMIEVSRLLSVGDEPVAVLIDEVPLLPELGPDLPLTARPA
jgi:hypothetical protein